MDKRGGDDGGAKEDNILHGRTRGRVARVLAVTRDLGRPKVHTYVHLCAPGVRGCTHERTPNEY
jgi:hypothetical protein